MSQLLELVELIAYEATSDDKESKLPSNIESMIELLKRKHEKNIESDGKKRTKRQRELDKHRKKNVPQTEQMKKALAEGKPVTLRMSSKKVKSET